MKDITKENIEKAIVLLAKKITNEVKSDDALRFSQAALNLAHVKSVLLSHLEPKRKSALEA